MKLKESYGQVIFGGHVHRDGGGYYVLHGLNKYPIPSRLNASASKLSAKDSLTEFAFKEVNGKKVVTYFIPNFPQWGSAP